MRTLSTIIFFSILITSCNSNEKTAAEKDNRIPLRSDTINVVKLSDTLVIFESTCRGCAVEGSTAFEIKDSLGIIKLKGVYTVDNNSPDMAGGNVSKQVELLPQKTGITTIKLFKYYRPEERDSTKFITYTIEVKN